MTAIFDGWLTAPRVGVVLPAEREPGWADAALWCALLEAWGFPAEHVPVQDVVAGPGAASVFTTLIVPAPAVDGTIASRLGELDRDRTRVLLTGTPTQGASELPNVVRFFHSAPALDQRTTEGAVDAAYGVLARAAPKGLVGIWRWPGGKPAALVIDGDVDHPTGIDPECSRYVAPAIETARRAGYTRYGIFAAAANVDAEPDSFPPGVDYYNHSYSHPYSHWNAEPWEALDDDAMEDEISRSNETFEKRLGTHDHGIFRLPHFQLEASGRTYALLDRLGYRAESSIGGNASITGGLPFHPALEPWSGRAGDATYARTHPDPARRHGILQLPISTDPTDPSFLHGCCSYNTLHEGVRNRTARPTDFQLVLEEVLARAVARNNLAHLFIDPPDMGFGRVSGDRPDYAGAVERWLAPTSQRDDLAFLSTAELTGWWLAREVAVRRLRTRVEGGRLTVELDDPPPGTTLALLPPGGGWTYVTLSWNGAALPS